MLKKASMRLTHEARVGGIVKADLVSVQPLFSRIVSVRIEIIKHHVKWLIGIFFDYRVHESGETPYWCAFCVRER
jgi:hypothetical protein